MYALGVMRGGFATREDDELGGLEDFFGGLRVVNDGACGSRRAHGDAFARAAACRRMRV